MKKEISRCIIMLLIAFVSVIGCAVLKAVDAPKLVINIVHLIAVMAILSWGKMLFDFCREKMK